MLAIYKPGESEDIPSVFAWYILPGELGSHPVLTPHRIKTPVNPADAFLAQLEQDIMKGKER